MTWLTWAIILAVGSAAALSDYQIPAGVLMLSCSIESALVVILGFRNGDRTFEKLDVVCLFGVLVGLTLYVTLKSPEIAVATAVAIDFVGIIPTIKHAWQWPHEEALVTYVLFSISDALILLVANFRIFTAIAYPLYVFVAEFTVVILMLVSPHRKLPVVPVNESAVVGGRIDNAIPMSKITSGVAGTMQAIRFVALPVHRPSHNPTAAKAPNANKDGTGIGRLPNRPN